MHICIEAWRIATSFPFDVTADRSFIPNPVEHRIVDPHGLPIAARIVSPAAPVKAEPALALAFRESIDVFSAFSSIDHDAIRTRTPSEAAVKRLDGIGHVLSELDLAGVRTQDDLTRMLLTLDTADKCIRAICSEFRVEAVSDRLARKAENLMVLIERARDELTGRHTAKS
jgi:hypothetical protein